MRPKGVINRITVPELMMMGWHDVPRRRLLCLSVWRMRPSTGKCATSLRSKRLFDSDPFMRLFPDAGILSHRNRMLIREDGGKRLMSGVKIRDYSSLALSFVSQYSTC